MAITYRITYVVSGAGGSIDGDAVQYVEKDDFTTAVTAVADPDYVFLNWNDGYENPTRTDRVKAQATYTAYFEHQNGYDMTVRFSPLQILGKNKVPLPPEKDLLFKSMEWETKGTDAKVVERSLKKIKYVMKDTVKQLRQMQSSEESVKTEVDNLSSASSASALSGYTLGSGVSDGMAVALVSGVIQKLDYSVDATGKWIGVSVQSGESSGTIAIGGVEEVHMAYDVDADDIGQYVYGDPYGTGYGVLADYASADSIPVGRIVSIVTPDVARVLIGSGQPNVEHETSVDVGMFLFRQDASNYVKWVSNRGYVTFVLGGSEVARWDLLGQLRIAGSVIEETFEEGLAMADNIEYDSDSGSLLFGVGSSPETVMEITSDGNLKVGEIVEMGDRNEGFSLMSGLGLFMLKATGALHVNEIIEGGI